MARTVVRLDADTTAKYESLIRQQIARGNRDPKEIAALIGVAPAWVSRRLRKWAAEAVTTDEPAAPRPAPAPTRAPAPVREGRLKAPLRVAELRARGLVKTTALPVRRKPRRVRRKVPRSAWVEYTCPDCGVKFDGPPMEEGDDGLCGDNCRAIRQEIHDELVADAARAEEIFGVDELEEYANSLR